MLADRSGGQRVRHEVAARGSAVDAARFALRVQREDRAAKPERLHSIGAHVGCGAQAEGADLGRGRGSHGGDAWVVGVQDGKAICRQRSGKLALGAGDGLDAAGALQMRRMHGQHHADLGPRDLGQPRDLSLRVHAHLEHRHFVRRLQAQQRHRQAGLRVQVALVAQHVTSPGQHVGDHLLGDRLAGRSGDAHHACRSAATPPGGQLLQPDERVLHLHHGHGRLRLDRHRAVHHDHRRTAADRLVHVPMPIDSLTGQRYEAAARNDVPRIDGCGAERGDGGWSEESATGGGQEVIEAYRRGHSATCDWFDRV
jgi:hypothetical protein